MTSTMSRLAPTDRSTHPMDRHSDALPPLPAPGSGNADRPAGDRSTAVPFSCDAWGSPVRRAAELLADFVERLDPNRLTGPDAATLYELLSGIERLTMAGRTLLAPRIDESGVWRDHGHRSPTVMLAELEGVPTGQARNTLEVGHRLAQLPETEEALRAGALSGPKIVELSSAAVLDPAHEQDLLRGAAGQPLRVVKERCQRSRATSAGNDPVAALRRIHGARRFASWTDSEGAFCFEGRDTPDRGARIMQQMDFTASRLRDAARRAAASSGGSADGPEASSTSERNLRADAFFLLMTGGDPDGSLVRTPIGTDDDPGPPPEQIADGCDPPDETRPIDSTRTTTGRDEGTPDLTAAQLQVIERPPNCSVMVRVDLDALLRGHTLPGNVCEIDNQGPVSVAMARDMADDSFLRFVFHRAGDIRAVSHFGRTINRSLRTALAHRDRCCVVPGCGVSYGLEIDHIVPFAEGGPTELQNLALLCHHHHFLKTYEGWTLSMAGSDSCGSTIWSFVPLPPFGEEPEPPDG